MVATLKNQRGQTTVEWLMLMAVTFITAYLMITGPVADFTSGMLSGIKSSLGGIVRNGENSNAGFEPGTPGHPSDPQRLKPLHLQ